MNRRKFALSWGRKLFFGISWPLTSVLTFLYLRSFILPETTSDWFYYASTFIGHIGLLNAAFYFLLYCPVVLIFPTYYISRIWSLLLILVLNVFVLIDALSFSGYHLHVYSYISTLVMEEGLHHLLGSNAGLMILIAGTAILSLLIWIRGEMTWRYMQSRFSNPVKNWYLVLIVFCLVISKLIYHYADIHPKFAEMFPLNLNFKRLEKNFHDNRRFYYPTGDIQCTGKYNPDIVMIILKEWNTSDFNPQTMPKTFHMKRHAVTYNNHRSVAADYESGIFSLLYSLPSSYMTAADEASPAFMTEITKRKYELLAFANGTTGGQFRNWIDNRTGEEINPRFLMMTLEQKAPEADMEIQNLILELQREDLLKKTHILITGASAGSSQQTPLLWVYPDRKVEEVNHLTTAYDVVPTLLSKAWACKKAFKAAGTGLPLDQVERDWYVTTIQNGYQIVDIKKNAVITVQDGVVHNSGSARRELIFPALRLMTKFTRPD